MLSVELGMLLQEKEDVDSMQRMRIEIGWRRSCKVRDNVSDVSVQLVEIE